MAILHVYTMKPIGLHITQKCTNITGYFNFYLQHKIIHRIVFLNIQNVIFFSLMKTKINLVDLHVL